MMPCSQHIVNSSSCSCQDRSSHCKAVFRRSRSAAVYSCKKNKNGFHKQSHKITNGKSLKYSESSSPDSTSEQQHNAFYTELEELIQTLEKDSKNLEVISKFVQKHEDELITWENSDFYVELGDLSNTIYMGQKFMQEAWEELYLPKRTRMQVFGTLENFEMSLPEPQWVILVGEDGCVYAYGDEELQLIAKSLREFVKTGKRTIESYYLESSDEEYESLELDEEILKIRQRGRDYVNKNADVFDDFLEFIST